MTLQAGLLDDASTLLRECGSSLHLADAPSLALEYARLLGDVPPYITSYQHVPDACYSLMQTVEAECGAGASDRFLRLVTAVEILELPARLATAHLPLSVLQEINWSVGETLKAMRSPRPGYFTHRNDSFSKALAVCRLKLLPCGIELFDSSSGIARSTLWKSGLSGGIAFARAWLEMGGHQPVLMGHWDARKIRDFSPEGYRRMYLVLAELLNAREEYLGVGGQSWWFDPVLASISPELAFLRSESAGHGAYFIPMPTDEVATAQALKMSSRRQALYREGRYQPKSYFWFWPRRRLLRWAEKHG